MSETGRAEGEILHLWLRLLGWQIEISEDGDQVVGVGRHLADGVTLRVGGCASTEGELVLELFEQAMRRLTCSRRDASHLEAA